ncbi:MAG: FAD-binding protein [Eubacteriales bacterium]|nr:FAD-binding protein [Eubacteriales bacterium]
MLEICQEGGQVRGAVVHEDGQIRLIACGALVLASGGFGGLFTHRLTSDDVSGSVQSIALNSGAELVNLEFMQIMPGYLSPIYKTVFNEKTFRFAQLTDSFDLPLLLEMDQAQELLDERAGYGPFTSRLKSRLVDLALFKAQQADPGGVTVAYAREMIEHPPELIRTYFEWMAKAKHLTMSEPAKIGLFAHAANGGIRIDTTAATRVPGLFACGEATGGMHGADRIGGLSTANGLVFGGIAGHSAARFARENPARESLTCEFSVVAAPETADSLTELRELMYRAALVIRTKKGLEQALAQLDQIADRLQAIAPSSPAEKPADTKSLAASCRLKNQLQTARSILTAANLRCESRGSHFRGDHPEQDPAQASPIVVSLREGSIQARFLSQADI